MSEFLNTLDATGVGGMLMGLAQVDHRDLELATREASRVAPETVIKQQAVRWKAAIHMTVINMTVECDVSKLLLLGNDLSLLEALAAIDFSGHIQLLLPARTTRALAHQTTKNVPAGLKVNVLSPGVVPVIEVGTTVAVIGFDAGSGYIMVEKATALALGAIRGQQYTGEVIAFLPLPDITVHERPPDWQMVHRDHFTGFYRPNGFEPVIPQI
jgi:hypothetical protein